MADITTINSTDQTAIFSKNTDLFKRKDASWEFFFRNTENVNDVLPLKFGEHEGLFVISDGKITKWTNFVPVKKIYLKVKDKAGNESDTTTCSTVSLDLQAIKDFVPSGKIIDIDEYGVIKYSFDSINNRVLYSGDLIDVETGIYESEVFNGTNNLVSWRYLTWQSVEPQGTSVSFQIRSAASEDGVLTAEWSDYLVKNSQNNVSIEHIKDQFLQYRAILTSTSRDISPSISSVTIANLTALASHFFTTNFVLPARVMSGIMTSNSIIPVNADIVYGINTKNSVNFSEYQIIEPNRIFTTTASEWGKNLRVGVKFISPGFTSPNSEDPYNETTHVCAVRFTFTNTDTTTKDFNFRVSMYNDVQRTQLVYVFFSGNDQTGWSYSNTLNWPAEGIEITPDTTKSINFEPTSEINGGQIYYLTIEAYSGSWEDVLLHDSYTCPSCDEYTDPYCESLIPRLQNLSILFSLENGELVKINA